MRSAKLKVFITSMVGALSVLGCANPGGGMAAKSASGIPLGSTGPHAVQPLPDKPRFGQPMSEAELAAWNIDIRKVRAIVGFVQHHNAIQPWTVSANGEVRNAIGQI